jgi:hypothetical protein
LLTVCGNGARAPELVVGKRNAPTTDKAKQIEKTKRSRTWNTLGAETGLDMSNSFLQTEKLYDRL